MKKILAIGNSFSEDATSYLHDISKNCGNEIKVVNLYIGGCSLQRHVNNIKKDAPEYRYDLNGKITERYVTIKEVLLEDNWDIITLQQASPYSGVEISYTPFLSELSEYIKKYCPNAKQVIHQTWAYEIDAKNEGFHYYGRDQKKMYRALKKAYIHAAQSLQTEIIPCGDVIQELRKLKEFDYEKGGISLCRDGFHLHLIYGRYAAACTWYQTLTGDDIRNCTYMPPHPDIPDTSETEKYDEKYIELIKKTVHGICAKSNKV